MRSVTVIVRRRTYLRGREVNVRRDSRTAGAVQFEPFVVCLNAGIDDCDADARSVKCVRRTAVHRRLLTHRGFRCPMWLERFFVFVALCCMEDAPASWVATHRQHHNESDHEEDPHSPQVLGINRVLWGGVFLYVKEASKAETLERYGHGTFRVFEVAQRRLDRRVFAL